MEKAPRNLASTASYLILRKNGKVLIVRRCNTGYQDGNYYVPAGHIDAGELPSEALIREVREEIGIDISPDDVRFVHISFRPKCDKTGDRVDYFFEVQKWRGEVVNNELGKCDDLKWVEPNKLPENTTAHVRHAIECIERGEYFSELSMDFIRNSGMYVIE